MASTDRKLRADIVRAYLECASPPEQTRAEIGSGVGMRKREVEDALWLLMSHERIEYGEVRAGGEGVTYKVAAVRER